MISEVCSEATWQPILQLYLVLPSLLCFNYTELFDLNIVMAAQNLPKLQIWSIITSCLSLAWSFNSYQATSKNGALDFNSNPVGRMILFAYCACFIFSRLFTFVFFAYSCGDGQLWPLALFILLHTLLMAFIHWKTTKHIPTNDRVRWKKAQIFYQCILNGISNLYMHNKILPLPDKNKPDTKVEGPRNGILVDVIIFVESAIIILIAFLMIEGIPLYLLLAVGVAYMVGLLFKVVYFKFFHIWKDTNTVKDKVSQEHWPNCCC